jgi:hypothetical protein
MARVPPNEVFWALFFAVALAAIALAHADER